MSCPHLTCSLGPRLYVPIDSGRSPGSRARFTDLDSHFAMVRDRSVAARWSRSHFHAQKMGSVGLDPDNGDLCPTPLMGSTKLLLVNLCRLLVKYNVNICVTSMIAKRSVVNTVYLSAISWPLVLQTPCRNQERRAPAVLPTVPDSSTLEPLTGSSPIPLFR